jgi:ElaB/YqjD/DUF883 family membrane-anchored ribosome-binding protein
MVDINELSDIDPTRVDLVRYPAVRSAKYLLFKSEKTEEENMESKVVKNLDAVLESLQKATKEDSDKIKKELTGLVSDVKKSVEDAKPMAAEVAKAVAEKIAAVVKSNDDGSYKDELTALVTDLHAIMDKVQKTKEDAENVTANIDKSGLSDDERAKLNQFMKAEADRIVKESQAEKDALREQLAKAEAERVEQRERIEKMERAARKTEWIAKAKADLDALPAKSDEIADLIMKAEDNDKEMADKMVTLLKASAEIIKKSTFYSEIGTSEEDESSPEGKISALAKSYLEQGVVKTIEQGRAKAWKEHPELMRGE